MTAERIERAFAMASEAYSDIGVDVDRVLRALSGLSISINCWQGDDVSGFEGAGRDLSDGGLQCTGGYPGMARSPEELRSDLEMALSLIPGTHRVNLHAMYGEPAGSLPDRDGLAPRHFEGWMDWAGERGLSLDFNPTFFAHARAASGFTLSSPDPETRSFWIDHGRACRRIGAEMGRRQGSACVVNLWVPDGFKDTPVDRRSFRQRLRGSLDEIFAERLDESLVLDALESKLFGIGSESCVIGSHEFYMGYAIANRKMVCLDTGHFHPTERVSDKVSSILQFTDGLLLHISRPVRWDSDHVPVLDDELIAIAREIVRGDYGGRVHLALDFFDATINRVAGWVIGARSVLRAFCLAMLEPFDRLARMELERDYTGRLALLEELRTMPLGAVWDHHCETMGVPAGMRWMDEIRDYESRVLSGRS